MHFNNTDIRSFLHNIKLIWGSHFNKHKQHYFSVGMLHNPLLYIERYLSVLSLEIILSLKSCIEPTSSN